MRSSWILLTLALSLSAPLTFGQYSGGSGSGGYHSSTGIAIGAGAAAAAGIGYLVLHNHNSGKVTGCLNGATLLDDSQKNNYTLINRSSIPLKAGDRVTLRGKKIQHGSATPEFQVTGLIKDYGPCER